MPLCKCEKNEESESHPCPYASEINDDERPCHCCEDCTDDCADDI